MSVRFRSSDPKSFWCQYVCLLVFVAIKIVQIIQFAWNCSSMFMWYGKLSTQIFGVQSVKSSLILYKTLTMHSVLWTQLLLMVIWNDSQPRNTMKFTYIIQILKSSVLIKSATHRINSLFAWLHKGT